MSTCVFVEMGVCVILLTVVVFAVWVGWGYFASWVSVWVSLEGRYLYGKGILF